MASAASPIHPGSQIASSAPGDDAQATSGDNLIVGVATPNDKAGLAADTANAGPSDSLGTQAAAAHFTGAAAGAGKPSPDDSGSSAAATGASGGSSAASLNSNQFAGADSNATGNGAGNTGGAAGLVVDYGTAAMAGAAADAAAGSAGGDPISMTTGDTFNTISVPGSGLVFENDFTGAAASSSEFQSDVEIAEETLAAFWTNPDTVALTFNDPNQGNNGDIADNSFFGNNRAYSFLSAALVSHDFGTYDEDSSKLPGTDPSGGGNWFMPSAYERMLGVGGGSAAYTDDSVSLNTFYTSIGAANDQTIINAMMHEISEGTMGRIGGLGGGTTGAGTGWAAMDLFRFTAAGVRDYTDGKDGKTTYFSYDGGTDTSSAAGLSFHNQFASGGTVNGGGDTADWDDADVFGFGFAGETFSMSITDIELMQSLGWDPYYTIAAGHTSTGITVETLGGGFVDSGGKVVDTFVNGGFLDVESGGVSSDTFIYGSGYDGSEGDETVFAGGISWYADLLEGAATATGGVQALFGGEAVSATINTYANQLIFGGGFALDTFDYWNQIVYTSGTAEDTFAYTGLGDTYLSGGTAYFTTLSSGAGQYVYSGGLGYEAFVSSGSFDQVLSSGTTSFTEIYNGGTEYVYSAGVTVSSIINPGGTQNVYSGGIAEYTQIGSGGSQYVYGINFNAGNYGESVSGSIAIGGNEYVESGGFDYGTYDNWNQFVYTGGETEFVSANTGDGDQYISGGTAYYTQLSANAGQFVFTGLAYGTDILSGGVVEVFSGATAQFVDVNSGGIEETFAGGVDYNTTIANGGAQYVYGDAYYGSIAIGGNQYIESGGFAYGTYDNWNQWVSAGGVTEFVSANTADGDQYVLSGGRAYFTSVTSGAGQIAYAGSFVDGTVVQPGGVEETLAGAVDSSTYISSGGIQYVYGTSYFGSIAISGNQYVYSGGLAYGTYDNWNQFIYTGGVTEYVSANTGDGDQYVSGGETLYTLLSGNAGEFVYSGGLAVSTELLAGGFEEVMSGGTALGSLVTSGGIMFVTSGGHASGSEVLAGGAEYVFSGGAEAGVTLLPGGLVYDYSGASVAFSSGGFVDGDTVDLVSTPANGFSYAGGVLTVTSNGTTVQTLDFSGSLTGGNFRLATDGSGGTDINFNSPVADFGGAGVSQVLFENPSNGDTGYWTTNNSGMVTGFNDFGQHNAAYSVDGVGNFTGLVQNEVLLEDKTNDDTGFWTTNSSGAVTGFDDLGQHNSAYSIVGVGDFTDNGHDNVLFENKTNDDTGYWTINSAGAVTGFNDLGQHNAAYRIAGVGDFTGNGQDNVLLEDKTNGDTGYWTMNSSGMVTGFADLGQHNLAYSVAGVGDFTGNGRDEVLLEDKTNGDTGYWTMNSSGSAVTGFADLGQHNLAYSIVGIGDFTGNGQDEVLFQNPTSGDTGYWTLNSAGTAVTGFVDLGQHNLAYNIVAA